MTKPSSIFEYAKTLFSPLLQRKLTHFKENNLEVSSVYYALFVHYL